MLSLLERNADARVLPGRRLPEPRRRRRHAEPLRLPERRAGAHLRELAASGQGAAAGGRRIGEDGGVRRHRRAQAGAVSAQGRVEEPRADRGEGRRRSRRARRPRAAAGRMPALPRLRRTRERRRSPTAPKACASCACSTPASARSANGAVTLEPPPPTRRSRNCRTSSHESAYVDEGAEIGDGTKIWHFSHVMKGARIGERCIIGQNVNVDGGTVIGNNVKIQNNVSVYTGVGDRRRRVPRTVVRADQRHQSALAGEPALAVRDDASEARLHDRRECDDRVRRDDRPLRVRRRRLGGDQGRAGLRADGRQSGAPGGLDEPPRPPPRSRPTPTASCGVRKAAIAIRKSSPACCAASISTKKRRCPRN